MPTLTAYTQLTLLEIARRMDPNGEAAAIAEVLTRTNEILQDAVWRPANGQFANKTVRRAALPTGQWRRFNAGVTPSSTQTIEVWDTMGMLEDYLNVDAQLAKAHPGGAKAYRQEEAVAFLEGMSQTLAATIIYGDVTATPERFQGLAPRLNAVNGINVVSAGGSGSDVTSIYIVQWGPTKVHMIYPPYDKTMGIEHRDLGEVTMVNSDGTMYQVYRDHFRITCGLVVRDPRCIARVANIESAGSTFDEDLLITVLNRMPNSGRGAVIYVNPTVRTLMEIALKDKTNVNFSAARGEGLAGEPVLYFRGCPVRTVEAILNTETAIT
ncbi:MAG: hypothetical protein QXW98_05835 [Candidatus Caldarchaeum sp.]